MLHYRREREGERVREKGRGREKITLCTMCEVTRYYH